MVGAVKDELGIERLAGAGVEVLPDRRTIVTALPLKKSARERLARLLDARVLDVREPFYEPDMVLTPACSPQLIGAMKRKYNGARVVIVELDDWDLDIELNGPVKRLLRAGADAYVLADSLEELASKIGAGHPQRSESERSTASELTTGSTVDELIAAFLRESIEYSTRTHADASVPGPRRP
jgi:hypothetical protein